MSIISDQKQDDGKAVAKHSKFGRPGNETQCLFANSISDELCYKKTCATLEIQKREAM